ncbi:MAG: hypothetical protein FWF98_01535 [Dehalococcoidia bacterium]|nr:hypothetical protein [Dehalococcoidia bacterium]
MIRCKKCNSTKNIKSGMVNDKQRYTCRECNFHFTENDGRTTDKTVANVVLCQMLYSFGHLDLGEIAEILNVSKALVYAKLIKSGYRLPKTKPKGVSHYTRVSKALKIAKECAEDFDATKPVSIVAGKVSSHYRAIIMLQEVPDEE